ncbi:MAG: methionyl-tRNA formyltransferase [Fermentimonas sp.]|jgi:methionyl-tRNA formyltransferase
MTKEWKKTDNKGLRIVFMGTPEFAVESLKTLVGQGYNVVGVVTTPDRPAGRGYKLQPPPVKRYALEQGLPMLQPKKLRDPEFLEELKKWKADLQVVVAFRMLPEVVWGMPPKGTFNLHSSLLPRYRGAAPINWAIINGESETGVTTFFLSHEIDTGPIIFQERTAIKETDTAGSLHDRLMTLGARLVLKTVDAITEGTAPSIPQSELVTDETLLTLAPKIFTEDCRIDWNQGVNEVYNLIRGLSPYPAAWTELYPSGEKKPLRVKIYACEIVENVGQRFEDIGTVMTNNRSYLHVNTRDGVVAISDLQVSGKKRLQVGNFLNGYKIKGEAYFQ